MLFDNGKTIKTIKQNDRVMIVDFSAIFHSAIHSLSSADELITGENGKTLPENYIKGFMINTINYYKGKYQSPDKVFIAIDKPPYWRKKIIAYKTLRKSKRDGDDFDWEDLHKKLDTIITEFAENSPWHVIDCEGLEADDVIAVIVNNSNAKQYIIISADSDLVQLQKKGNVIQYSPMTRKEVVPKESPEIDLLVKILKGDPKDSVPNIFSDDDFYLTEERARQKPITKKFIQEFIDAKMKPERVLDDDILLRNFFRNKLLLDLTLIPEELQQCVIDKANAIKPKPYYKFQKWLAENKIELR